MKAAIFLSVHILNILNLYLQLFLGLLWPFSYPVWIMLLAYAGSFTRAFCQKLERCKYDSASFSTRRTYPFMHKCNSTLNTLSSIANQTASLSLAMRFYIIYILIRFSKQRHSFFSFNRSMPLSLTEKHNLSL